VRRRGKDSPTNTGAKGRTPEIRDRQAQIVGTGKEGRAMTMTVQKRAVKRWGKSFPAIVHELAHQGHSRASAAKVLGYKCHKSFHYLCNHHGWNDWFLPVRLTNGGKKSMDNLLRANEARAIVKSMSIDFNYNQQSQSNS
jgi:hypothetical protein